MTPIQTLFLIIQSIAFALGVILAAMGLGL